MSNLSSFSFLVRCSFYLLGFFKSTVIHFFSILKRKGNHTCCGRIMILSLLVIIVNNKWEEILLLLSNPSKHCIKMRRMLLAPRFLMNLLCTQKSKWVVMSLLLHSNNYLRWGLSLFYRENSYSYKSNNIS